MGGGVSANADYGLHKAVMEFNYDKVMEELGRGGVDVNATWVRLIWCIRSAACSCFNTSKG